MQFVNISNLVNDETGLTFRQENNLLTHKIPLGSIVEVLPGEYHLKEDELDEDYDGKVGLRLYVVQHNHRDCDGTPLYSLSFTPYKRWVKDREVFETSLIVLRNEGASRYDRQSLPVHK